MPIFDPSQYQLWGYSLPTDPAGKVRTLSTNTAGHIARLLQTIGLDTASFESTVTFPDGMTPHYMSDDTVDGWGYPVPIAARREPPQPELYRDMPNLPDNEGLEWCYRPCAGIRDLGRYIFTESHAGALDSTTWAFPVATAMGWQVDAPPTGSDSACFRYGTTYVDNPNSLTRIDVSINSFSFSIYNGKRTRTYGVDTLNELKDRLLYFTGEMSIEAYTYMAHRYSFQFGLPEQMAHHISHIQNIIDESLREVKQW